MVRENDLQDGTETGDISNMSETQRNNSLHYTLQKFGNRIPRAMPVQLSPSANGKKISTREVGKKKIVT